MSDRDAGDGPYCTTNAQCTRDLSIQSICRSDHTCVPIINDDCPIVYGNSQDPGAVLFGGYAHIDDNDKAQSSTMGSTPLRNYGLALREINANRGLPDQTGNLHTLGIVVCNRDSATPADGTYIARTVDHLVNDLAVSAIVADLAPDNLAQAFHLAQGKGVFWISPGPQTQELADLHAAGLLWNLLGSPREVAPIYPALLDRIIARIQPNGGSALRIAVVHSTDPAEPTRQLLDDLSNDVNANLPTQLAGVATFTDYYIDVAHTPQDVVTQLVTYAPHIVISMAGTQFTDNTGIDSTTGVVAGLERQIRPMPTDHPRPYYIFNPVNFGERQGLTDMLKQFPGSQASAVYQRFLGVNVARTDDRTLYNEYLTRLKLFFPGAEDETESWYDAIYYLAYSMYLGGLDQHPDGARIRPGMLRLLAGTSYNVGPSDIPLIIAALQSSSSSIQLVGTVGPPVFYPDTGARVGKGALFCFDDADAIHPQEQVYEATSATWSGSFSCYPGL